MNEGEIEGRKREGGKGEGGKRRGMERGRGRGSEGDKTGERA